ncbi:polysaccharide pyruvyl transferase family protein [Agarivorans aestuarii]|uniref:polysaccharide pyruvyl transferase family protein n=1 Tax=Agarivorans aestuarii TaxID=1563703 RepID=UPI001C8137D5|nr:polysaccharide pyruvyl transferase family protein [Agarivorans aestuarii]
MSNVYLMHAYSPNNSGDGLLVNMSLEVIRDLGIDEQVTVVALDKKSFIPYLANDNVEVIGVPEFSARFFKLLFSKTKPVFFAVGGGYLRSGNMVESLKALIVHGSQLLLLSAFRSSKKIYLPQSIGPLKGPGGAVFKKLLNGVDSLYLRDDKSVKELQGSRANKKRYPDLVAMSILERVKPETIRPELDGVCLVIRDLPANKNRDAYLSRIDALLEQIEGAYLAVQSSGRGNDDASFYREQWGQDNVPSLKEVLEKRSPLVVSVRLHGSLETLAQGVPSIHLAYERKGIAAYGDLGLNNYVYHVNDIPVDKVVAQVEQILNDPSVFWDHFERSPVRQQFLSELEVELND